MSRQCPDCLVPMNQLSFRRVTVDDCPQCGGVWFDEGELCSLVKSDDALAMIALESQCSKSPVVITRDSEKKLCPNCQERLTPYKYAYSSDVILDECDECFGVWVQDGELQKIADYLESSEAKLPSSMKQAIHDVAADFRASMATRPNRAKQLVSYWSLVGQRRTSRPL